MFEARFYQAPLISSGHQNEWSLQMNLLPPHVYIWGSTPGALASCYELLFEGKIQREWRIRELGDNMAQISFRHSSETLNLLLFALHIDMQTYTCKYPFFPINPNCFCCFSRRMLLKYPFPSWDRCFQCWGLLSSCGRYFQGCFVIHFFARDQEWQRGFADKHFNCNLSTKV